MPPLDDYVRLLEGIWERRHLTNGGPLMVEFEGLLKKASGSDRPLHCVANGGLALQLTIKAMGLGGEVVTTPYSYVATTSCPLWEGLTPVFADIDASTLNIDPAAVEAAITPQTEAVLATHVFGNPCDVAALEAICERHGLALIYDAAHAFGVRHAGRSILDYGDASIVSLHATKVIHSVEGGFVTTRDPAAAGRIEWMRRFGHNGQEAYHGVGINAKMSELHAAMGICLLRQADAVFESRKALIARYLKGLPEIDGARFAFDLAADTEWNHCYFPVRFETEEQLLAAMTRLDAAGFGTRRYFHPSLDQCGLEGSAEASCPVARDVAARILCLPLSTRLELEHVDRILDAVHPPRSAHA
ncbi:aminotransferase DegT [Haloferula helveola]|uniref:Aminotransferase DegT n=2 Tax=Haloferula helveola TaxID=490095 RepID=A0ABM7RI93_9BACT|nr:aminotransferase DegT [Haloferula helveola]